MDVTGELALRCPACAAPLHAEDRFCEACGAEVGAPAPAAAAGCRACGAPRDAIGDDGYCTVCGVRERAPGQRAEADLGIAAAVSEQGRSHRRNEDAFHLERVGERDVVAVVCDGISTAASGDVAARAAAAAAGAILAEALRDGGDLAAATAAAVHAAGRAVQEVPWVTSRAALALPSCTLVSAACRGGEIVVGWIGDSRAYWLAPDDARQLTIDDSWAAEQVAEGRLSLEEAEADHRAHSITRWVGADAPPDAPHVTNLRPATGGRLVLCTDGLWNAASAPADLADLLDGAPDAPAAVAHRFADAAMELAGRDDVTVAVVDVDPEGAHGP
ncbi:MAG TPA: protein phosphatase 2C domain-containing protein [Solirubrobacteraceae bacterium]|nr:protein phosphatase 2C domain-containing protein [Solirubrobacteraceae bacterium]